MSNCDDCEHLPRDFIKWPCKWCKRGYDDWHTSVSNCGNCASRDREECGIDGHEVYDDTPACYQFRSNH